MADSNTPNLSFTLPEVGASADTWGGKINDNWNDIDGILWGGSEIRPDMAFGNWKIGGVAVTTTAVELNRLDGVTWALSSYNNLTANAVELNYSIGVTSGIQGQLDGRQPLDATLTALAGTGTAANKVPYFTGADTAAELTFLDEDDMASNAAQGVASQQSIKAYVDAVWSRVIGINQTWQNVTGSRTAGTTYQNTTLRPITASVYGSKNIGDFEVSTDGLTWVVAGQPVDTSDNSTVSVIVPAGHYYRIDGTSFSYWAELRE